VDVPLESWLDPKLVVHASPIHGLGAFAVRRIRAGDVVMRLGGDTVSDAEVRRQMARGERYDGIVLEEDLNLRIKPPDWPGIHGNHSCDPNLWLAGSLEMAARRDIEVGEEVSSDYAAYTLTPDWSMDCACGSRLCRGRVTGNDWRQPALQKRYEGHFARPIGRRIATS
jgi:uncharacterized protein